MGSGSKAKDGEKKKKKTERKPPGPKGFLLSCTIYLVCGPYSTVHADIVNFCLTFLVI